MNEQHAEVRCIPRRVGLVIKADRPDCKVLGGRIQAWLNERSVAVTLCSSSDLDTPSCSAAVLQGIDLLIVLGGDGTIVGVARRIASAPVPLLGINFGKVGFLAAIQPDEWEATLVHLLAEGVPVTADIGLRYALFRDGVEINTGLAINDVVISRSGPARLVTLDICADEFSFSSLRADGLIVATPTGSTGYTGSAHGPLLHPGLPVYAVTAICPFLNNFLPFVLGAETQLRITMKETSAELLLTVDGQEVHPLQVDDVLTVTGAPDRLLFARLDKYIYYKKLLATGFVSLGERKIL